MPFSETFLNSRKEELPYTCSSLAQKSVYTRMFFSSTLQDSLRAGRFAIFLQLRAEIPRLDRFSSVLKKGRVVTYLHFFFLFPRWSNLSATGGSGNSATSYCWAPSPSSPRCPPSSSSSWRRRTTSPARRRTRSSTRTAAGLSSCRNRSEYRRTLTYLANYSRILI